MNKEFDRLSARRIIWGHNPPVEYSSLVSLILSQKIAEVGAGL